MLTTQYIRTLLYTLITMCVSCYANDFKDELFNAILAKDLKTCKTLIKEVDVNTKDNNGWTPLHYAADFGYFKICHLLLENGADLYAENQDNNTPIRMAEMNEHRKVSKLLTSYQLFSAIEDNDLDSCQRFVDNGWDVNIRNSHKRTPLHCVAISGNYNICLLLANNGADFKAKDKDEMTPLHQAAKCGHFKISKLLLDHTSFSLQNFDINVRNKWQDTPLHVACHKGHSNIAMLLIQKGADRDAKNKYGETPLDLVQSKYPKLYKALKSY